MDDAHEDEARSWEPGAEAWEPDESDEPGVDGADTADWDAYDESETYWDDDGAYADGSDDGSRGWLAAAAALLGAAAMLLTVLVWSSLTGRDETPAAATKEEATPVNAVVSPDPVEQPAVPTVHGATRLSRCTDAVGELEKPLAAAGPALDQWAVHVGAMNKLVVGEITLQQAMAFWDDTRVGAKRNMARFDDALAALHRHGLDCPDPGRLAPGAKALPGCARTVQAELGVLRAARTSLATWDVHIHHMDMLRLGQMTPEDATSAWLSSWQQGVRQLDDYEAARREAGRADGCARAGVAR